MTTSIPASASPRHHLKVFKRRLGLGYLNRRMNACNWIREVRNLQKAHFTSKSRMRQASASK
jgi:hypothetical protein